MNGSILISLLAALWTGFVLAISFMESWLKFRAKGVTLQIGLSIGSLVFKTLNRVEWVLICLMIFVVFSAVEPGSLMIVSFSLLLFILCAQTMFLLPKLSRRAQLIIGGAEVPAARAHLWFVIAEVFKAAILVVLSLQAVWSGPSNAEF